MRKGRPVMRAQEKAFLCLEWPQNGASAFGLTPFNELSPSKGVDGQGAHNGTQAPPSEMLMRRVCFCTDGILASTDRVSGFIPRL